MKFFCYLLITAFFFPSVSFAALELEKCSSAGYTVATINGVLTDEDGAIRNMEALMKKVGFAWSNQKIKYEYLLNPIHSGGFGDLLNSIVQKAFENETVSDYDLIEMLNDASKKVKTQKLLLVAHSQGNFYANSFYDVVAGQEGGIPKESIGVYAIATPASRVVDDKSRWITSDTDKVIAWVVGHVPFKKIMKPNEHIVLQNGDGFVGHDLDQIYLKYRANEIIRDINYSLDRLSKNTTQRDSSLCLSAPKITFGHKAKGVVLAVTDPVLNPVGVSARWTLGQGVTGAVFVVNTGVDVAVGTYHLAVNTALWTYNTTVATTVWTYNTAVATANFIGDTTIAIASTVYDAVAGVLADDSIANNNVASVILTTQEAQDPPSITLETNIQPVLPQTTTNEPATALFQLTHETSSQTPPTETQTLSKNSILADTGITEENSALLLVKSTTPPQTETNSGYYGGGGSSAAPAAPVPQSDVTAPTITIIGDNPATISVNSEYVDTGATAADDVDGVISVTSTSTVNTAILGSYFVTYTAVDVSGNTATITRAVNIVDTNAPEITINGTNPTIIEINSTYSDLGATASDAVDGARPVVTTSNVDTSRTGTYLVTYVASDLSQNTSTSTRTVNVVDIIEILPILFSDLNVNGIADAEESDVIATSTMSLTAGEYHFNNLTITNNATLTLSGDVNSSNTFKGVKIVATNITVNAGSHISADGQGYSSMGPGSGAGSIAASYGGVGGGNTAMSTYGSATRPIDLGSGVGSYRGGGAMRIIATDTILNNGRISANGSGYRSSGGSIYITTNILTGDGTFTAKGSDASGWPQSFAGSGGRIALHYKQSSFIGIAKANSGVYCLYGCNPAGGAGTVAFFDTTNNDLYTGTSWRFQKNDEPLNLNRIVISNGSSVTMDEGVAVTASELVVSEGTSLPLSKGSLLTIHKITVDGATIVSSGEETIVADILELTNSAIVTVVPMQTLILSVPNVIIDASSRISVDAKGDTAGAGFPSSASAGGSHGGVGLNNIATSTYGSAKQPTTLGSAGGAPHAIGGGAIRLVVSGALVNNGIISADGNTSSSGGSIYAAVANMSGSGTFHANGGALGGGGYFSGPGGGGRVAIYYQTSSFSGTTQALGGCGSYDGWSQTCAEKGTAGLFDTTNNNLSAGSSWRFQANDGTSNFNNVTFTSGAVVTMDENVTVNANELQSNGASLAISNGSSITIPTFIVSGGTVTLSGGETLAINTLTLSGNAIITVGQERTLSLSVTNLTIAAGSSISANYKGYGQSAGPGAGFSNAGASHGGVGLWNTVSPTYGSTREPTEMGSGGNGHNSRGGGAIRLVVSESLANNGSIVAAGNNTSSGGSIYVTTNSLSGAGEFRADGGTVYCSGSCVGAGAGGRIAVYYQKSTFSGMALASGPNTSYGKAGDGTVVVEEIAPAPPLSSARAINTFLFLIGTSTVSGIVDETTHTVSITVPFDTEVSALSPTVAVSSLATSSPASAVAQNFTNPVIYTVTAEDGSTQAYTVTVTIAPDTVSPVITSYTFNGAVGDITVDFATPTSVSVVLTASENVDWVSTKIENQNTPESYKIFFSGVGCVDGTATCLKSWDGTLSSGDGGTAPNGIYRIKTNIRDLAGNIYQDYLSPYIITVNTVLP